LKEAITGNAKSGLVGFEDVLFVVNVNPFTPALALP
jgi:hypothetical protein